MAITLIQCETGNEAPPATAATPLCGASGAAVTIRGIDRRRCTDCEKGKFHRLMFHRLQAQGLGKWGFTMDSHEMAQLMIRHIDERRSALGIDKARKRTLVDMADRRELKSA